jgi:16S rRNA (adenine1518-N6/adenine1519-N6)-dimethyltransferase
MAKSAKIGQNFLHDKNIAAKIIDIFAPPPGPVLEIGAGPGILSAMLVEKFSPGRVTLVEIDPLLALNLRERFGERAHILEKDILELDLAELLPEGSVSIIGNLPYHISKPLVDWFIAQRSKVVTAVLMLQRDFVDKLLAGAGNKKYNAQSIAFQTFFKTRRLFQVHAGAFAPAPQVVSTVLAVRPADPLPGAEGDAFYRFVKLAFGERRKTLINNLAPFHAKKALAAAFAACDLPEQVRAEALTAKDFLACFRALDGAAGGAA